MAERLNGKRIALLIDEGFSARQVVQPTALLREEGAEVVIVAPLTKAPYHDKSGTVAIDATVTAGAARVADFHALLLPGGYAPDRLRMRPAVIDFVTAAMSAGLPIGAICHGPQVLISANLLRGRTLTCWPSIAVDVKNAGGLYVDRPAVRDGNLVTARKSDDVPPFLAALTDAILGVPATTMR
jgi:protease I